MPYNGAPTADSYVCLNSYQPEYFGFSRQGEWVTVFVGGMIRRLDFDVGVGPAACRVVVNSYIEAVNKSSRSGNLQADVDSRVVVAAMVCGGRGGCGGRGH